jgi:hypothetical protein
MADPNETDSSSAPPPASPPVDPAPAAAIEKPPERALEPGPRSGGQVGLTVRDTYDLATADLGHVWRLASQLSKANGLLPEALAGKPDNVFLVLLKGAELGVSAMTALAEIMIVTGKLTISSHLQNALVIRSGKAKQFRIVETTEERAVIRVQRHDWEEPTDIAYTFQEAKDLGLPDRRGSAWNTQRANMLRRRVITRAAREFFGDVVVAYDPDEVDHEPSTTPAPASWGAPPASASVREPTVDDLFDQRPVESYGSSADLRERATRALAQFRFAIGSATTRDALREAQNIMMPFENEPTVADLVAEGGELYQARWRKVKT